MIYLPLSKKPDLMKMKDCSAAGEAPEGIRYLRPTSRIREVAAMLIDALRSASGST